MPNVHVQVDLVGAAPRTNDAGEPESQPAAASGLRERHDRPLGAAATAHARAGGDAAGSGARARGRDRRWTSSLTRRRRDRRWRAARWRWWWWTRRSWPSPATTCPIRWRLLRAPRGGRSRPPPARERRPGGGARRSGRGSRAVRDAEDVDVRGAVPRGRALRRPCEMSLRRGQGEGRTRRSAAAHPHAHRLRRARALRPSLPTDAAGRATVTVKLPDSLTRYRVMAVAAAGAKQFGKGESTITARLPLMVRPSPPRFLNFGDASSCRWWCRTRRTRR